MRFSGAWKKRIHEKNLKSKTRGTVPLYLSLSPNTWQSRCETEAAADAAAPAPGSPGLKPEAKFIVRDWRDKSWLWHRVVVPARQAT